MRTDIQNSESEETDNMRFIFYEKFHDLLYSLTSSWENQSEDF